MRESVSADERQRLINRAGLITIGINLVLTVIRALAALQAGSAAVLADAANSGTDILATLVVLGGTRIATLPPDENHPYGHEKAEPVAAKVVGILVTIAGAVAAYGAWATLQTGSREAVGLGAAIVTGGSILVKEGMARYLLGLARRLGSQALRADGANQRTDVLASSAALVGALGGRFGFPALDPAMAILVSGLILRMGLTLYWRSVTELMDPAPEPEVMDAIRQSILSVAGVRGVNELKARVHGAGVYVDCKIAVDGFLSVDTGHRIAGRVKRAVRAAAPEARGVLVHVNPLRRRIRPARGDAYPVAENREPVAESGSDPLAGNSKRLWHVETKAYQAAGPTDLDMDDDPGPDGRDPLAAGPSQTILSSAAIPFGFGISNNLPVGGPLPPSPPTHPPQRHDE